MEATTTEARALALAHRVQAPNSAARHILVVALDAMADALMPLVEAGSWRELRAVPLRSGAGAEAAVRAICDTLRRGMLDQVIIVAALAHDIAETETICARCVQEEIKVGAILVGEIAPGAGGRTAAAARRYAETIAIVRDVETVAEILHAIGA